MDHSGIRHPDRPHWHRPIVMGHPALWGWVRTGDPQMLHLLTDPKDPPSNADEDNILLPGETELQAMDRLDTAYPLPGRPRFTPVSYEALLSRYMVQRNSLLGVAKQVWAMQRSLSSDGSLYDQMEQTLEYIIEQLAEKHQHGGYTFRVYPSISSNGPVTVEALTDDLYDDRTMAVCVLRVDPDQVPSSVQGAMKRIAKKLDAIRGDEK